MYEFIPYSFVEPALVAEPKALATQCGETHSNSTLRLPSTSARAATSSFSCSERPCHVCNLRLFVRM